MKYIFTQIKAAVLFLLFTLPQASSAQIYSEITHAQLPKELDPYGYDQFLRRVGFEDFSAGMQQSLNEKNFLNPYVSPRVLNFQIKRYQIYNYARELATEVLNTLHTSNRSPESRDKIIEFVLRLVMTKPTDPPNRLPERFRNDPDGATMYLMEVTRDNIEQQSEVVMADLLHVLYGKKVIDSTFRKIETNSLDEESKLAIERINQLQSKVTKLVQFMYLDNDMGGFSVSAFGKALVLGLTRYQKLKDRELAKANNTDSANSDAASRSKNNLIEKLKQEFKKYNDAGYYYENYVGTTLIVNAAGGVRKKIEIRNGDFIFERSFGQQANEIISGARPGGIRNYLYAAKLGLMGAIFGRYLHQSDDSIVKDPGLKDLLSKKMRETAAFTNGVSHAGVAEVIGDADSDIWTTRELDNYTDAEEGGIRFTDILHQFAKKSEFLRLIVARPDVAKLAKHAIKSKNQAGYREVVQMGDQENKDKSIHSESTVPWKALISESDYNKLYSLAVTDPVLFSRFVAERSVLGMKRLYYQGIGFAYHFSNSFGRGYCTSTIVLSYLRELLLDPQVVHDRWNYIVQVAKKLNFPGLENYNLNTRLIAPGGLIWQKDLIDPNDIQIVDHPLVSTEQRISEGFSAQEIAMNPELHRRLRTINIFVKNTQVGAEEAARKSVMIAEIEDAMILNHDYSKFGETGRPHGRPVNSYLARAQKLIPPKNLTEETSNTSSFSKKTKKESKNPVSDGLSCKQVFQIQGG